MCWLDFKRGKKKKTKQNRGRNCKLRQIPGRLFDVCKKFLGIHQCTDADNNYSFPCRLRRHSYLSHTSGFPHTFKVALANMKILSCWDWKKILVLLIYLKKAAKLQFSNATARRKLTFPKGSRCTAAGINVPTAEHQPLCQPRHKKRLTPHVDLYEWQYSTTEEHGRCVVPGCCKISHDFVKYMLPCFHPFEVYGNTGFLWIRNNFEHILKFCLMEN